MILFSYSKYKSYNGDFLTSQDRTEAMNFRSLVIVADQRTLTQGSLCILDMEYTIYIHLHHLCSYFCGYLESQVVGKRSITGIFRHLDTPSGCASKPEQPEIQYSDI